MTESDSNELGQVSINFNSFGDAVKKGLMWGFVVGAALWIIIVFSGAPDSSVNLDFEVFIAGLLLLGTGGGILGGIITGIIIGAIEVISFIGGTLFSFGLITYTTLTATVIGWASFLIVPILLMIKKNAPKWFDEDSMNKVINGAISAFLLQALYTLLRFFFEKTTGLQLLSPYN